MLGEVHGIVQYTAGHQHVGVTLAHQEVSGATHLGFGRSITAVRKMPSKYAGSHASIDSISARAACVRRYSTINQSTALPRWLTYVSRSASSISTAARRQVCPADISSAAECI